MATFTQGYTFGATEQVTNTKLHSLVSSANVSGIVGTEISTNASISGLSLAPITQSSKISGSSLFNLSSLPSLGSYFPAHSLGGSNASNASTFLGSNGLFSAPSTIPSGGIIMWSGTVATIPSGWYLCDGSNGTPDLRDRFIVGAKQDDAGVAKTNITGSLTQSGDGTIPSHSHDAGTYSAASNGAHTHTSGIVSGGGGPAGVSGSKSTDTQYTFDTSSAGAHTHTISGSSATSGTGTVVIAKYYALAFIMKA